MKLFRNNNIEFGSIEFSDVTSGAIKVTGTFVDYKGLTSAKGFSMKKHSADNWTDSAVSASTLSKTYSSLDASTKYDFRMYATVNGVKQYSAIFSQETSAESAE